MNDARHAPECRLYEIEVPMTDRMTDEEFQRILTAWADGDAGKVSGYPATTGGQRPTFAAFAARVRELQADLAALREKEARLDWILAEAYYDGGAWYIRGRYLARAITLEEALDIARRSP
jgi:hypothetical protein